MTVDSNSLDETAAKGELDDLQKKYAALVVNFNNQQEELKGAQSQLMRAENEIAMLKGKLAGESGGEASSESSIIEKLNAVRPIWLCMMPPLLRRAHTSWRSHRHQCQASWLTRGCCGLPVPRCSLPVSARGAPEMAHTPASGWAARSELTR